MKTLVQTPTNRLDSSLEFYKKLEFTVLSQGETNLVSDGKVVLEINPDRFSRAGIKFFDSDWSAVAKQLQGVGLVTETEQGFIAVAPSGVWVYLINGNSPWDGNYGNATASIVGNYMGVSLESVSMEASVKFWEVLGFKTTMGAVEQGWIALANDEGFGLSVMKANMCPHLFFNPSLTYFNGKNNPEVIEKVRAAGIPITEEITHFNKEGIVDNIIIRDPGGLGFFVFND